MHQLLLEVHLLSVSSALPVISKLLYQELNLASPHYKAAWLLARVLQGESKLPKSSKHRATVLSRALSYPMCDLQVFKLLYVLLHQKPKQLVLDGEDFIDKKSQRLRIELPKRLFRQIVPVFNKGKERQMDTEHWDLLQFLLRHRLVDPECVPSFRSMRRFSSDMLSRCVTLSTLQLAQRISFGPSSLRQTERSH